MKPLLAGLAAAALVALAGCYTSDKLLLDPSQAATPLAVGHQIAISTGEDKPEPVDIRLGSDRWYVIHDVDGKDQKLLFTPLAGGGGGEQRYAFVSSEAGSFIYGVAVRRAGAVYFDLPSCDQIPAREAAAAHGVVPPAGKALSPVCTFTSAASLTGALKDYADKADLKRPLSHLPEAE